MVNPTISVIIGVYNCALFLQDALDSLYSQTFQDFEIILCDDGSTDDTFEIAKNNARLHPNIVLLQNGTNIGLNRTLNKCLSVARGELIARMDGDDVSLPTRFEIEYDFLKNHPEYDIVSCPMIYFDGQGEHGRGIGGNEPTKRNFINSSPFCHAPCMVRKSAYDAVGGYTENPRLIRHEDYNLWAKMYADGRRGYNLNECLYAMRDDRNASFRRRTFKAAVNGIYSTFIAYRLLQMPLYLYVFCLKPLVIWAMPLRLYESIHKQRIRSRCHASENQ